MSGLQPFQTQGFEAPMTISMYQASVPAFVQTLNALDAILVKADAHCAAKKIDPAVLVQSRLYPDMFPLARQVQIVCDFAKGGAARLAGKDAPSWPDNEATITDLRARIAKTLDFVKAVKASDIDGSEARDISLKVAGQQMDFKGLPYLTQFVLPNLYFHAATAYGILRHNGLEIGKRDFMGAAG
jgi:uncharacterized protein